MQVVRFVPWLGRFNFLCIQQPVWTWDTLACSEWSPGALSRLQRASCLLIDSHQTVLLLCWLKLQTRMYMLPSHGHARSMVTVSKPCMTRAGHCSALTLGRNAQALGASRSIWHQQQGKCACSSLTLHSQAPRQPPLATPASKQGAPHPHPVTAAACR